MAARLDGRTLQAFVDEAYRRSQTLTPCARTVADAHDPPLFERYAAAHEGIGWIFDWNLTDRAFKRPLPLKGTAWAFTLHSVVNMYGFMVQTDGAYVRCRLGDADNGIGRDVGAPSAAERARVAACGEAEAAWAAWTDASKAFPPDEQTHDTMGEEVVQAMFEEITGISIDDDAFMAAPVQRIEPRSFLRRLIGR